MHMKNDARALTGPLTPANGQVADPISVLAASLGVPALAGSLPEVPATAASLVQGGSAGAPADVMPLDGNRVTWHGPLRTGEAASASQLQRYLASTVNLPLAHHAQAPERPSGPALARLIEHDVRVVQRFHDHAWVAGRLLACGAIDSLVRVVASGLLHGVARHCYRLAIEAWLNR